MIKYLGSEYKTYKELVEKKGLVNYKTFHRRLTAYGLPLFESLVIPKSKRGLDKEVAILYLHASGKYEPHEIAAALNISLATVYKKIS